MERGDGNKGPYDLNDIAVDGLGVEKPLAAMDNPVAYRLDFPYVFYKFKVGISSVRFRLR